MSTFEYKIVTGTQEIVEAEVTALLRAGWDLAGGVANYIFANNDWFSQAMIRETK